MTIEELERYGVERMTDEEVRQFMSGQSVGVLGLPTGGTPYLVPLSYGFDGEKHLYFTYVVGEKSRKTTLSDDAREGSFLVYRADSAFRWTSVLTSGRLRAVPDDERESAVEALDLRWRPEIFEEAGERERVALYRLEIETQNGIKHTGLPPELEDRREIQ